MNQVLAQDLAQLETILADVSRNSLDYLQTLHDAPTSYAGPAPKTEVTLPQQGLGASHTLQHFNEQYRRLMVASAGPRYWGFVTGGTTPAALAGDWLASAFDQNTQSPKVGGAGDVSAVVEMAAIRLLLQLFHLPDNYTGGFVTGATISNFTCLGVARQWAGAQMNRDIAREGMTGGITVLGGTPHSSVIKSLSMLGFGSANIVKVNLPEGREAIDINHLTQLLEQYKGQPVIVNSSGGTVNTVDFDDLQQIAALKEKYTFWWHVDAAFGGFAACSPPYAHLVRGWELADSITIDCHKWMNVPYDSAVFLVKKVHELPHLQTFQNSNAPYLGNPAENFSYLNFLPENSRRFRALPAWFSLMAYGREGFAWMVENSVQHAQHFGRYISGSKYFKLSAPVRLNVVCFELQQPEHNAAFLAALNVRGKVFMTPSVLNGKSCLRAAFVNWRTEEKDVLLAIAEMEAVLTSSTLLSAPKH